MQSCVIFAEVILFQVSDILGDKLDFKKVIVLIFSYTQTSTTY